MPRESGYSVRVDAFIPVDPGDIDRVQSVATAIKTAQDSGDLGALLALGRVEPVVIKPTTRAAEPRPPAPDAPAVLPDQPDLVPARQIGEDA